MFLELKTLQTNLVVHEGLQTPHTFVLYSFINIPFPQAGISKVFN